MVRSWLLGSALVLLGAPACAQAAITLSATSSPAVVSGPPPWTGSYRLDVATGDLGGTFSVFAADGFAGASSLELGFRVTGAASIVAEGAGSARGPLVRDPFSPGGWGPCIEHGPDSGGYATAVVALPPNSTGSVEARQTLAVPPWPGDDLGLRLVLDQVDPTAGFETIPERRVIKLDGPRLSVARGVRIAFSSPLARYRADIRRASRTTTVKPGARVLIRGRVDRPLRGQTIELVESRGLAARPRSIARVRIRRGGRFSFGDWRPSGRGAHFLGAVYRPRSPAFAGMRTKCGPVVIVRRR